MRMRMREKETEVFTKEVCAGGLPYILGKDSEALKLALLELNPREVDIVLVQEPVI
jgi:hypothetical protein